MSELSIMFEALEIVLFGALIILTVIYLFYRFENQIRRVTASLITKYILFMGGYALICYWARGWGWNQEDLVLYWIAVFSMAIFGTRFFFINSPQGDKK